jgi:hypothetical protein
MLCRLERLEAFLERGALPVLSREELEADSFRRVAMKMGRRLRCSSVT